MLEAITRIMSRTRPMLVEHEDMRVMAKEGHANYVTNIDIAVQEFLTQELQRLVPGSKVIGEEGDKRQLDDQPTWVIDPIDGTTNFLRGRGFSAVSVALLEEKSPRYACIYQPFTDELFTARKGSGAYCNGSRIHVSDAAMDNALIGFGTSPYNSELADPTMKLATAFLKNAGDLRRCGSAALDLADVACGRLDVFFELRLSPWDVAAGALLVEEAGGRFCMPLCERVQFDQPSAMLASNPNCMKKALELFEQYSGSL